MLKPWQQFAYFSQWLIAAGAVAQCWQTGIWLQLPQQSFWLYIFVFTSTLLLYLFHFRFWWIKKPVNDRQHFLLKHKNSLLVQFIVGAILLTISFFKTGVHFLIPISLMAMGAGAYTYFIYKPRQYGIFKYNGLFKILTLTFVWTAVTAVLPVAAVGKTLLAPVYLFYYFQRWLFMLALCLPFDVRDMHMDSRRGNMTVPVLIGEHATFRLCYLCLLLCALLPFLQVGKDWYGQSVAIANVFTTALTYYSIYYSSQHLKDDFSWFLLDSNLLIRAGILGSALFF
jgi:4-hydroxybenzoate polyprenyltransferase